jgi:hypothetical protein
LLSDSLSKVAVNGGDAREVVSKIPKLLVGLSGDALDAAMNLIANADWTT